MTRLQLVEAEQIWNGYLQNAPLVLEESGSEFLSGSGSNKRLNKDYKTHNMKQES